MLDLLILWGEDFFVVMHVNIFNWHFNFCLNVVISITFTYCVNVSVNSFLSNSECI